MSLDHEQLMDLNDLLVANLFDGAADGMVTLPDKAA